MGDALDPKRVSRILKAAPTIAYAKGQTFRAKGDVKDRTGRTGLWLLSTDGIICSGSLTDHLAYLLGVLIPDREDAKPLAGLHALLAEQPGLEADVACFWHGAHGARRPAIPKYLHEVLSLIPAKLELDFATDGQETDRHSLHLAGDD